MKKLMVMVAAATLCGAALALDPNGYVRFTPYASVDPSPSSGSSSLYSVYFLGPQYIATSSDVEWWLENNGGITRENIAKNSTTFGTASFTWDSTAGQYTWQASSFSYSSGTYFAMVLAATSAEASDFAYEILSFYINGNDYSYSDTHEDTVHWTVAPEPTSGLLLLLGVAGLALKRKRA